MNELGLRICDCRCKKHWSQQDLADRLGVDRGGVSLFESGKRIPKLTHLIKMAELFNVTLDYLVFGKKK